MLFKETAIGNPWNKFNLPILKDRYLCHKLTTPMLAGQSDVYKEHKPDGHDYLLTVLPHSGLFTDTSRQLLST